MNNFIESYKIIHNELQKFGIDFSDIHQIRKPKLTNLELIAMNLSAEYLGIDSECQLFRAIKNAELKEKIERSVYNRRKRLLFMNIERVRFCLANFFNENEFRFIIDSMPAEVCKNARANRSKICKDIDNAYPDKGFCASQQMY